MLPDPQSWRAGLGERVARIEGSALTVAVEVQRPDGVRFGHRADATMPAPSTLRLAVLAELFRQVDHGTADLGEPHRLRRTDQRPGVGVLWLLHEGLELTLGDLAALMTVAGDDSAAGVLVRRLGPEAVEAGLGRMGLTRTRLGEPVTTAQELAALLAAVIGGTATSAVSARRMTELLHAAGRRRGARQLHDAAGCGGLQATGDRTLADVLFVDLPEGRLLLAVLLDGVTDEPAGQAVLVDLARLACGG